MQQEFFTQLMGLIKPYYEEAHRAYHNWDHPMQMLQLAEKHGIDLSFSQRLAILCHDLVYIPGHEGNEIASVKLMQAIIAKHFPLVYREQKAEIEDATTIIMDTVKHVPTIEASKVVIDLDLYRLAVPYEEFRAYGRLVYAECPYMDEAEFKQNQIAFFSFMLEKDRLFTSWQLSHLGDSAIANMTEALANP
ncbi:hypothetical protein [Neptuniibacter sp. QD37_11]|uniref:hypothetical protein n=1 Tax=Neptuniibacter sp. QD37_11 TaxID=3398209 RepID=UPI0039F544CF